MTRLTIYDLEMLNPFELGELLHAEVRMSSPDVQFIQDLLIVGCPIDAKDSAGWTALHYAACDGHLDVVKFLISIGSDVNARNKWGNRALYWAAMYGHLGVVKFLISAGADANARDHIGHTAWVFASEHIREECPELKP